ncbi:DUF1990 domain-containing protein [Phycicoccus sp. CSK15P-2]|uniref:DUF1990 family protein n=1 Tax=Phycicoccus sp. CSK15P-2 TaxID=2807627 RepID=UPI0027DE1D89|nr:DUF1990 domain-containing protein [Phycicoccus sp. CSK15P-2]
MGATGHPDLMQKPPRGFRPDERWGVLGRGDELFERVADDLLRWGMQRGSGIRVAARDDAGNAYDPDRRRLRVGDTAVLRIGRWPVDVPVRVLAVVDEPDRASFTYGTLTGHPESGEELFEVVRDRDGLVRAHLRAFSRPGRALAWFGYPVLRAVQEAYSRRYLEALPLTR